MLHITPGEREALQLLSEGKGKTELAASLEVSEVDVDARLRGLFSRMGVRTAREAAAECARRGLLSRALFHNARRRAGTSPSPSATG